MGEDLPNRLLRPSDIPSADVGFPDVIEFANRYPGYAVWGDAKACWSTGRRDWDWMVNGGAAPSSLTKLRTALFATSRLIHMENEGEDPEPEFGDVLRALMCSEGPWAMSSSRAPRPGGIRDRSDRSTRRGA